jgi:hypothetical protein
LFAEAQHTLEAIRRLAKPGAADPWTDPATLAYAVKTGLLDAPQLKNSAFARGQARTCIIHGACEAVDATGRLLTEAQRLAQLNVEELT